MREFVCHWMNYCMWSELSPTCDWIASDHVQTGRERPLQLALGHRKIAGKALLKFSPVIMSEIRTISHYLSFKPLPRALILTR